MELLFNFDENEKDVERTNVNFALDDRLVEGLIIRNLLCEVIDDIIHLKKIATNTFNRLLESDNQHVLKVKSFETNPHSGKVIKICLFTGEVIGIKE